MKKLILAMTLFCALLLPCFSQKEKEAYRYLENKIRESFDLEGTPIIITFKSKGEE